MTPEIRAAGGDRFVVSFPGKRPIELSEKELRALLGQRFRDAARRELALARQGVGR